MIMTTKEALMIVNNVANIARESLSLSDSENKKLLQAIYKVEKHIKHEVK